MGILYPDGLKMHEQITLETAAWKILIVSWHRRFVTKWTVSEITGWVARVARATEAEGRGRRGRSLH
jgi:hypothetical protein